MIYNILVRPSLQAVLHIDASNPDEARQEAERIIAEVSVEDFVKGNHPFDGVDDWFHTWDHCIDRAVWRGTDGCFRMHYYKKKDEDK